MCGFIYFYCFCLFILAFSFLSVFYFYFYFSPPSPQLAPIKYVFGVEIWQRKTRIEREINKPLVWFHVGLLGCNDDWRLDRGAELKLSEWDDIMGW